MRTTLLSLLGVGATVVTLAAQQVYHVDVVTGKLTQVLQEDPPGYINSTAWSRDGKALFYVLVISCRTASPSPGSVGSAGRQMAVTFSMSDSSKRPGS